MSHERHSKIFKIMKTRLLKKLRKQAKEVWGVMQENETYWALRYQSTYRSAPYKSREAAIKKCNRHRREVILRLVKDLRINKSKPSKSKRAKRVIY